MTNNYEYQTGGIEFRVENVVRKNKTYEAIYVKCDDGVASDGMGNSEWYGGYILQNGERFDLFDKQLGFMKSFDSTQSAREYGVKVLAAMFPEWFTYTGTEISRDSLDDFIANMPEED